MTTKTTPEIIYTGNFNKLGDEACVVPSHSDWGELGWMVCLEMRVAPYIGRRAPKFFFRADELEAAIECAKTL